MSTERCRADNSTPRCLKPHLLAPTLHVPARLQEHAEALWASQGVTITQGQASNTIYMRAHLVCVGGEHGAQRQADFVDGQGGRPAPIVAIVQNVQAGVPVAVDVRVHWAGRDEEELCTCGRLEPLLSC